MDCISASELHSCGGVNINPDVNNANDVYNQRIQARRECRLTNSLQMSTPKRRKTNGYKSSPQTVGSLDFFFNKKKNEEASDGPGCGTRPKNSTASLLPGEKQNSQCQNLTDEELARKLQTEWNEQDNARDQNLPRPDQDDHATAGDRSHCSEATDLNNTALDLSEVPSDESKAVSKKESPTRQDQVKPGVKKDTLALQSTASAEDAVSSTVPFEENPLTFDPAKYLPDLKTYWASQGGEASYGLLTRCFVLVNSTQSRIKIVDTLVNLLRTLIEGDPESLLPAVSIKL